jgi:putative inorganic carbon (HCO3(-)) transporter
MSMVRLRDAALPLLVAMVYLNLSAVFVRQYDLPSLLQALVVLLAVLAVLERGLEGMAAILLQPLTFLLASFIAVLLLTTTFTSNTRLADARVMELLKALGIFILVLALASSWKRLRACSYTIVASATFLSILGLYQSLSGNYGRWFGGFARVKNAHIYGDVFQPRIAGPLGDPNFFAQILLMAAPLALFAGWESPRKRMRAAAFAAAALMIGAILLTYSRGGMLALGVVLVLALMAHRVDKRRLIAGAAALAVLLLLLPASFTERFITIEQILPGGDEALHPDSSFQKRKLLTATAWEMFKDKPLLGVGAGNYTVWYDHYAERVGSAAREYDDPGERHYPHSLYLEIAAESGLAGLAVFAAVVAISLAGFRSAFRELSASGERELAGLAKAFEIALIGYLVSSLFLHGHFQRYLWLLFAFSAAFARLAAPQTVEDRLPAGAAQGL